MGAGAVPIPILDFAAVAGIQLDMLKQLSSHYDVPYSEEQGKSWLGALSASLIARIGANALKLIPGIGSIIGGVSMSIMSGASTYALAQVAIEHFEQRGTFEDLDIASAKERYAEAYEEGKAVASKAVKSTDDVPPPPATDPIDKLERLAALHSSGALTDAEFSQAKATLLG
jgi:uncharacterized protein (DUF697 family)